MVLFCPIGGIEMTAGSVAPQAVLYSILGGLYTYLLLAALLAKNSEAKAERWFDFLSTRY